MSAPAAEPDAAAAAADAAPKKSKKKLIIIVAAALVLCGGGGGGFFFYMKQKAAAEAAAAEGEDGPAASKPHADPKHAGAPVYVPLDAFVVNLADKEADRFAQIGVTLQVDDSKVADQIKTFMPAIRNSILMILAHKSSDELLERSGKEQLAAEILLSAARTLGIPVGETHAAAKAPPKKAKKAPSEDVDEEEQQEDEEEPKPKKAKKGKAAAPVHNPITQVHFSNFIIQ
jgi:flagellar protein FliL